MRYTHFLVGWRTMAREPGYSLVVIFGLAIGMAAALLLLGFAHYSWGYNAHVPFAERVYVVKQQFRADPKEPWFDQAPLFLRRAAEALPGVERATAYLPIRPQDKGLTARIGGQLRRIDGLCVLPSFPALLGVVAITGDVDRTLAQPEGIILTEQAAQRLFGTRDAVGRTLAAEGNVLKVGAVVRTPPANTTIPFELLVGNRSLLTAEVNEELSTGAQGWWGKLLVRLRPDAAPDVVTAALQRAADAAPALQKVEPEVRARLGTRRLMELALGPLRAAYFDQQVGANYLTGPGARAHPLVVAGLGALACVILALAAANYVNLAALRMMRRQREIALRKLMGARSRDLAAAVVGESVVVALVATVLGLSIAALALPAFSALVNRELDGLLAWRHLAAGLGLGVLLGLVTAIYPAWIAVRVRPAHALAGRDGETVGAMRLRRALTAVQTGAAMGLGGMALAVAWQAQFALRADAGFDPAGLLVVDLPQGPLYSPQARSFISALAAQPEVAGVTVAQDAVGRHADTWFRDLKRPGSGTTMAIEFKSVGANFFELYGIKPLAGRLFQRTRDHDDDPNPLVINAIAARELGFASPEAAIGQPLLFRDTEKKAMVTKTIVGVAPELRFTSLREKPRALVYDLWTGGTAITVRASGSIEAAEARIESLWRSRHPDALLRMTRAGAILAQDYEDDLRLARLLLIGTVLALAISACGTFALSALTVQHKSREIVMRRLYGARSRDISLLLARDLGKLMLAGALIGLPVAAVAIERYLSGYVERAPIGAWPLLLAFAGTCGLALLAGARNAVMALRLRPAAALRVPG